MESTAGLRPGLTTGTDPVVATTTEDGEEDEDNEGEAASADVDHPAEARTPMNETMRIMMKTSK